MNINKNRLIDRINAIGNIGKESGKGITRIAYSNEYKEASSLLIKLLQDLNLEVIVDGVGNIFGRRKGLYDDLPAIIVGSHLDTVKDGGLYDGNLGINAALEIVNILNDNNYTTNHPIEVVAFTAEEGDEMGGTFGSRVITGLQDINEKWLDEKLKKYGMNKQDVINSLRDMNKIKAFLELHIEQGGSLYSKNIPIGIVNGIAGITRYNISVTGEANHAGTTPMLLRRDALTAAAKLIDIINSVAIKIGDPFVATVGVFKIFPDCVNVIPGNVEMTLEMRDLEQSRIEYAINQIKDLSANIENIKFDFTLNMNKPSVKTDNSIIEITENACKTRGIEYQIMPSGAGHDAKALAQFVPTGMIFVPSIDGKSHCKEENTNIDDIVCGLTILLDTIIGIDKDK